jgi:DNA-binding CsgD family transcriptional regulator
MGRETAMSVVTTPAPKASGRPLKDTESGPADELIRKFVSQVVRPLDPSLPSPKTSREEIIIDTIVDGARYLLIRMSVPTSAFISLTPREQEIVRMVAKGYPNKTIAGILNISTWTVGTHLRRIFAKLGVASRAAMIARIMEEHPMWDHLPAAGVTQRRMANTSNGATSSQQDSKLAGRWNTA